MDHLPWFLLNRVKLERQERKVLWDVQVWEWVHFLYMEEIIKIISLFITFHNSKILLLNRVLLEKMVKLVLLDPVALLWVFQCNYMLWDVFQLLFFPDWPPVPVSIIGACWRERRARTAWTFWLPGEFISPLSPRKLPFGKKENYQNQDY